MKKVNFVAFTFKIHPQLLEEIDELVDNVHFRSRAHVINCAVDDWLKIGKKTGCRTLQISKKKHSR